MNTWDSDRHELVFVDEKDKEFHIEEENFWKMLRDMAL